MPRSEDYALQAALGLFEGIKEGFVPFRKSRFESELENSRTMEKMNAEEEMKSRLLKEEYGLKKENLPSGYYYDKNGQLQKLPEPGAKIFGSRDNSGDQGSTLSPDAADLSAKTFLTTGVLPALGLGATEQRTKILNRAAEMQREQGLSVDDVIKNRLKFKGQTQTASSIAANARIEDQKVNQATHLRQLLNDSYDPESDSYKIPPSMHSELALGLARLLSPSGAVAVELEEQLRQKTAKEGLSGALIYLGFDPQEIGGTTDSVSRYFAKTIERQGSVAEKLRNAYKSEGGSSFSNKNGMTPFTPQSDRRKSRNESEVPLSENVFSPKKSPAKAKSADDILRKYGVKK